MALKLNYSDAGGGIHNEIFHEASKKKRKRKKKGKNTSPGNADVTLAYCSP